MTSFISSAYGYLTMMSSLHSIADDPQMTIDWYATLDTSWKKPLLVEIAQLHKKMSFLVEIAQLHRKCSSC